MPEPFEWHASPGHHWGGVRVLDGRRLITTPMGLMYGRFTPPPVDTPPGRLWRATIVHKPVRKREDVNEPGRHDG